MPKKLQSQNVNGEKLCKLQSTLPQKASRKMLVKLTPFVANFTIILQAAFVPIFFRQKNAKPNCKWRKALQNTLVQRSCLLNVGKTDTWG